MNGKLIFSNNFSLFPADRRFIKILQHLPIIAQPALKKNNYDLKELLDRDFFEHDLTTTERNKVDTVREGLQFDVHWMMGSDDTGRVDKGEDSYDVRPIADSMYAGVHLYQINMESIKEFNVRDVTTDQSYLGITYQEGSKIFTCSLWYEPKIYAQGRVTRKSLIAHHYKNVKTKD